MTKPKCPTCNRKKNIIRLVYKRHGRLKKDNDPTFYCTKCKRYLEGLDFITKIRWFFDRKHPIHDQTITVRGEKKSLYYKYGKLLKGSDEE